jgi:AraC family transcriptional regulator
MKKQSTIEDYQARVTRAYQLISRHIDRPIDIAGLAKEAAFSLYHFHRIYRAMVGETVVETHRRLRLERAAKRIIYTRLSITDIALEAGYETPQAFSRAFKGRFGQTPAGYRKKEHRYEAFIASLPHKLLYFSTHIKEFKMNVDIEKRETTVVFGIRHVGPYQQVGAVFESLWGWACNNGLVTQIKHGICICYDDPLTVPAEQCRADACIEFYPPFPQETGDVKRHEIPAGTYARYRHIGPYHKLADAYEAICAKWIPANGYELAEAPSFEVYQNDPANTPEEQLITDIYLQLIDK